MGVVLIVLAVIAGLAGALLLLLAMPVSLAFRCQGLDALGAQVSIRLLFGLLRFQWRFPREPAVGERPRAEVRDVDTPGAARGRGGRPDVIAMLRQAEFRQRAYRFFRDLAAAAHLHELSLWLRVGLGDPADTGRLWALLGPLQALAQNLRAARVRIEPEFFDPVLAFEAEGRARVTPLQVLALGVGFALSPVTIRAWQASRAGHG